MRILGELFIIVGVLLCFTVLFFMLGLGAIAVGALLVIAHGNKPTSKLESAVSGVLLGAVVMSVIVYGFYAYEQQKKQAVSAASPPAVVQAAPHATKPAKKRATKAGSPSRSSAAPLAQ
jgi:uncharacterized membrane protein YebE (DUF533 family)